MVAAPQPVRAVDPIYILGAFSFLWMGFYVGLLFGVGSMIALMAAGTFFRGKFRLLVGFGGGFFGLAAWFNILLNYKDQYEQVVAFFARFMTENWAHFVCDSFLCSIGAILFVATIFQNEPPLPPRVWELRQAARGPLTRRLMLFGPGAGPTTRFAATVIVAACALFFLATAVPRWVWNPTHPENAAADVAGLSVALGHVAVGLFVLCSGALIRVLLRSGVAARVLSQAFLIGLIILPFLIVLLGEADGFRHMDDRTPLPIRFTPIFHLILGIAIVDDEELSRVVEVAAPVFFYGLMAFACWLALEGRVRRVRKEVDARREASERAAEERARRMQQSDATPEDVAAALARVGAADAATAAEIAGADAGEVARRSSAPPAPPGPEAPPEDP